MGISNNFKNQDQSFLFWARMCAAGSILIGMTSFVGWLINSSILKSFLSGYVEMKTNAALGYIVVGISLWFFADPKITLVKKRIAQALSLTMILLGAATCFEYLLNSDFGIDQFLMTEKPGALGTAYPNRMAFTTALNFILKGVALLLIDWEPKDGIRPSQFLSLITAISPAQALVGYLYGVKNLFGSDTNSYILITQMAVHSAVAWLLLSLGTLLARPHQGIMRPFTEDSAASKAWLYTLVVTMVSPPILGFMFALGVKRGIYDPAFGYSVLAVGCVVITASFVWKSASRTWKIRQKELCTEDQLRKALNVRDEFLRIASHELKTPITSLKLWLDMVKRSKVTGNNYLNHPEQMEKVIDISSEQVTRLTNLIEELLDVARIQSGKVTLNFETINLGSLLRKVIERFRVDFDAASCEITTHIEDVTVMCDPFRFEQVIINLLTNVIKYGSKMPVEINLCRKGTKAHLEVKDHGAGIEKDMQEKIFEQFQRASGSRNINGLGLGLYISKQIVALHKGKIWVESTVDVGSSFFVEIPLIPRQKKSIEPPVQLSLNLP